AIGLAQLGAIAAPVALVGAAIATHRLRMLGAVAIGVLVGAGLTSLLSHWVVDDAQPASWQALVERESWITGRAFPTSAYLAGAVAATVVLVHWLGPRWSRVLWVAVAVLAVVRIVSGTNLPLDLIVAFGVGVAAGSLALLVVGSPDLSPHGDAVVAALRRSGLHVASLVEQDTSPGVTHSYRATGPDLDVVVDVRSDGDRERDAVAQLYGRIRTRTQSQGELSVSVEAASERSAFMGMWLDHLGLHVATPVAVAHIAAGAALVARSPVPGTSLSEQDEAVDDAALVAAWRAIAALHRGRIAHGALDTDAVVVDDDGTAWLQRLQSASIDAPDALLMTDRAAFLVATSLTVGEDRALAACRSGLGDDGLRATLPYLQTPALPLRIRLRLRGREKLIGELRRHAGAETGADEVELVRLARVKASTLLALAGGILALFVLLPQLTSLADAAQAMADAHWPWLLPVVGFVALGYVCTTATLRAAAPVRPPFGLSYLTQIAAATLNRVTPNGIGGLATNIRFLQRSGYDTTQAATIMTLVSLNGGVAGALLIVVFLTWAGQSGAAFPWPSEAVLLVAFAAVLGLVGLVLAIPALRRLMGDKVGPIVRQARGSVTELLADPRRCAVMLGGSIGNSLLQLASLWFTLHAFGPTVGIAVMGAVLFGGKAIAGAAPTPGGIGAVEAALIGGLAGAGVDPAIATPATLVFRLLTNWAVVVPGWFALRTLRKRHESEER
ncbi:MAG TPA: lysylphosphatidylglycerol synthase transmembrane domain-containing protein, partial [Acidimicrobiales bacterium]|nr:lysylphosphatidylglycerol synthase transmembrane domain-containing protein [Acidimicrobiales bacterium]